MSRYGIVSEKRSTPCVCECAMVTIIEVIGIEVGEWVNKSKQRKHIKVFD